METKRNYFTHARHRLCASCYYQRTKRTCPSCGTEHGVRRRPKSDTRLYFCPECKRQWREVPPAQSVPGQRGWWRVKRTYVDA